MRSAQRNHSAAGDIYSLGRLLYFLLLEKDPPLRFEDVPKLTDLRGKPPALVEIVRKCTMSEPKSRYRTVNALLAEINKYEIDPPIGDVGIPTEKDPKSSVRRLRAHPRLFIALIGASAAVIALVLGITIPSENPPVVSRESISPNTTQEPPEPKPEIPVDPKPNEPKEEIIASPGRYVLVKIPGGEFLMGSPENEKGRSGDEGPQRKVKVSEFYLGKYEVTNEEYGRFLKENKDVDEPMGWTGEKNNNPVVGVSWYDAKKYCDWAGLRLPSEAEWEYAARAGTTTRFSSGDKESDLGRVGWYEGNSKWRFHPVGEKDPNPFGLYDMHGNVWEWVEDDWHGDYNDAPTDGSAWVNNERAESRVVRGGSFSISAELCRSAFRGYWGPGVRFGDLGFRPARSIP